MVLLLAFLLHAALQAPASTPAAPLKTIVRERVSPLCAVLHEEVAPAVADIRTNDLHFERAAALFLGVQVAINSKQPTAVGMTMMNMETEERSIADSIIRAETLLGDQRLQKAAQTDPAVAAMKNQLSELTKLQNDELNVISGVVETYANGTGGVSIGWAPLTRDQQRGLEHPPSDPPAAQVNATDRLLFDRLRHLTAFDLGSASFGFAHLLAKGQMQEQPLEGAAAKSIVRLAPACRT